MMTPWRNRWLIGSVAALIGATTSFAADTPPSATAPAAQSAAPAPILSKAQREKLAALHEQMAACLRSDSALADCHAQMQQACRESMGSTGCPGLGRRMGPGMHRPPVAPPPGN